jgi:hypothetical protein
MQESELLRVIQQEIRRHDFSYFVDQPPTVAQGGRGVVVPAGGLSPDHTRWVRSPDNYFLPKKVLRKVFRGKFVSALERAFQNGQLNFHADLKLLANPKTFAAWLRPLFREQCVVYLKPPFGSPAYVLQYLGPLHPSRGHLQPPPGLLCQWPSHFSLVRFR